MRSSEGSPFLRAWRTAQDASDRFRQKFTGLPLPARIAAVVVAIAVVVRLALSPAEFKSNVAAVLLLGGLAYGPYGVAKGLRSAAASVSVAALGLALAVVWVVKHGQHQGLADF